MPEPRDFEAIETGLLEGPRLRLTPVEDADLPALAEWYRDSDLLRRLDALSARPRSEAEMRTWLEEARGSRNQVLLGIRTRQGERLVGYVELDGILWPHGVAGVGLAIGAAADRGRGYGREAMSLLCALAFQELGLHRLTLTIFAYNRASIALAERLGFQREGVFRELLLRDGRRHDMLLYGLLAPEWRAERAGAQGGGGATVP